MASINVATNFEGRKGRGGVVHGSRELKSKIHGSRELKQTFHESRTIQRLILFFTHIYFKTDVSTNLNYCIHMK